MSFEFRLPEIGEGVLEGEVVRWLVREGDAVREDQPMVEVMTDKATVEIPSPRLGRIVQILVAEGKICPVGGTLVLIGALEGSAAAPSGRAASNGTAAGGVGVVKNGAVGAGTGAPRRAVPAVASSAAAEPSAGVYSVDKDVLATPATRKLARELGVALTDVAGSGAAGRISERDVRAVVQAPSVDRAPAAPVRSVASSASGASGTSASAQPGGAMEERLPFRGLRKRIAENLSRSVASAAHYTYVDECDATELVALRARAQTHAPQGVKLSYLPFFIKAVVASLKRFPQVNSRLDAAASELVLLRSYHMGVATATPDGLMVPVIRDADRQSLPELAVEIERLSQAARAGKCTQKELAGSTFTITSLGTLGGVMATPILNFPEVAILSIHKIVERPVVRDGQIVVRRMMNLSLSLDHRVIDGYEGAQFLADVIQSIEDPSRLLLSMV